MTPLWQEGELFLVRRVTSPGGELILGCWLDWPLLEEWLLDTSRDLLPAAELEPVERSPADDGQARLLASLPVRLNPGAVAPAPAIAWSPLRISLAVAWACVLLAVGAIALMLFGVWSLSERRAAFVSAVTHELRTPLTTFRLYTEMLGRGMVADEGRRREYLRTLATEADRLSHLVENILAYARLERGQPSGHCETVPVSQLLARITPRLSERARQANMELVVDAQPQVQDTAVRADISAVEQILFNLVDNACKYAAESTDRRIHLEAKTASRNVTLRLRDHGPGLSRSALRRLFRPFNKSARDAAESAPGVGLGLALSRRYARAMGGELNMQQTSDSGTSFTLRLASGARAKIE
jgi:signal transduction histidine kinase